MLEHGSSGSMGSMISTGFSREIERKVREGYRRGLREAERRARDIRARQPTWGREPGRTITRIVVPRPPRPRGPERGGGGFER